LLVAMGARGGPPQNAPMKVLIVFAHPEPASFSAALKDEAVAALSQAGHAVAVSDLYAMGRNPALGPEEFAHDRANPDFLDLAREQERAHRRDSHAADVRAEQAKVAAADLLMFHFPVWWFGMPAMLKGWDGMPAYTGFTVLPPFVAWMPGRVDGAGRAAHLAAYRERLATLDATEPLFFHPWEDHDESQRLKPGVVARSGVQWNSPR